MLEVINSRVSFHRRPFLWMRYSFIRNFLSLEDDISNDHYHQKGHAGLAGSDAIAVQHRLLPAIGREQQ